ncbi:hypothetical protein DFP72DRAFT_1074655 [Ephemerocybe angulata]|uniref:Uncharacterized protein n=1 Tax=Ephemerocybe angulata TaxID=980116 RepID=A0A8H6HJI6_9AGAR|nr:hypothetical protein DFP72DRAFT_1074655 [Tulosesus angulatus]
MKSRWMSISTIQQRLEEASIPIQPKQALASDSPHSSALCRPRILHYLSHRSNYLSNRSQNNQHSKLPVLSYHHSKLLLDSVPTSPTPEVPAPQPPTPALPDSPAPPSPETFTTPVSSPTFMPLKPNIKMGDSTGSTEALIEANKNLAALIEALTKKESTSMASTKDAGTADEKQWIASFFSFLQEEAATWAVPYLQEIEKHYANPASTYPEGGSWFTFVTAFKRASRPSTTLPTPKVSSCTGFSNADLMVQYANGLSKQNKGWLAIGTLAGKPASLSDLIKIATDIDDHMCNAYKEPGCAALGRNPWAMNINACRAVKIGVLHTPSPVHVDSTWTPQRIQWHTSELEAKFLAGPLPKSVHKQSMFPANLPKLESMWTLIVD